VSSYRTEIEEYADAYRVSTVAKALLLAHWPLVRLRHEADYGDRRIVARGLLRPFSRYRFLHRVSRPDGKRFVVAMPFAFDDLHSFREVVIHQAYRTPWPLENVSTVVDLGANVGMSLIYFAHATTADHIIAVEANPALIRRLLRVAKGLPLDVDVIHAAVATGTEPTLSFFRGTNNREGHVGEGADRVLRLSIGDVLERSGISDADVLKIDIEGAEHQLLANEPESFVAFRYVLGESHGSVADRDSFTSRLRGIGFEVHVDRSEFVDAFTARRID
jgi:FkbM family methyltransferase